MARRYAPVRHDLVIEPFAGSAGFSVRHAVRRAILCDLNPQVAEVWRYLIATPAVEIRALPLLEAGQDVSDLPLCQEARWLIGWNLSKGAESPRRTLSAWARVPKYAPEFWGERVRERIAGQVDLIRGWSAVCGDFAQLEPCEATWFVDPPYSGAPGRRYRYDKIDYPALADWCKALPGQVIVCEADGADWLPFESIGETKATNGRQKGAGNRTSREVAWQS